MDDRTRAKSALMSRVRELLTAELAQAQRVARETAEAANHPEARPENDKDTRKLELSYLARGQAARAEELETGVGLFASLPPRAFGAGEAIAAAALVELEMDGKAQRVFIAPAGGGLTLQDAGGEIRIVTPKSPLGRGLIGKRAGDAFELEVAGKAREIEIVGVS